MDVLDLMETKLSSFTKTDRAIYERIKKYPEEFAQASYDEIVEALEISPSALTRFAKRLGFSGYSDMQYQLAADLAVRGQRTDDETTASVFGDFLKQVESTIDRGALDTLAQRVRSASTVHCLGFNLSGLPARFLSTGLAWAHGIAAENPDFDYVKRTYSREDLVILFSVASGDWYRSLLQRLRKAGEDRRPHVTLVTMNPKHSLRRYCDSMIVLPTAGKVGGSHTAVLENMIFMMFNDLLLSQIAKLEEG